MTISLLRDLRWLLFMLCIKSGLPFLEFAVIVTQSDGYFAHTYSPSGNLHPPSLICVLIGTFHFPTPSDWSRG